MATTEATKRPEIEPDLIPFRITDEQYRRALGAGIFGEPGRVALVEGFLVEREDGSDYLLTAEQVFGMLGAEVFQGGEARRFTLWQGRLVERMAKKRPRCFSANKLNHMLIRLVPQSFHVEMESTMLLGEMSLPEPDLIVIRGALDDYRVRTPTTGDVALIVEVADTTLKHDSGAKLGAYASKEIPVYWIVNLVRGRIAVYARPAGRGGAGWRRMKNSANMARRTRCP